MFETQALATLVPGKHFVPSARKATESKEHAFTLGDIGDAVCLAPAGAPEYRLIVVCDAIGVAREIMHDTMQDAAIAAGRTYAIVRDADGDEYTICASRYLVFPRASEDFEARREAHHARAEIVRQYTKVLEQDKATIDAEIVSLTRHFQHDEDDNSLATYQNVNEALRDFVEAARKALPARERTRTGKRGTAQVVSPKALMQARKAPAPRAETEADSLNEALASVERMERKASAKAH